MVSQRSTYFNIQALRGLASCMVVLYHSSEAWSNVARSDASHAWSAGSTGVDIFFVISGFVMAFASLGKVQGSAAAAVFMKRRIIRVMPLYWIVTASVLLHSLLHLVRRGQPLIKVTPAQIIESLLLLPYNSSASPIVGHAWTLSYEMFFYVCLAAMVLLRKSSVLALTTLMICLVGLGQFRTATWPEATAILSPWLLEFTAGLWIGHGAKKLWSLPTGVSAVMASAGLLGLWFVPLSTAAPQRILHAVCAVMLVQAAVALERKSGPSVPVWALLIGDASYSIYLLHPFLLGGMGKVLLRLGLIAPFRERLLDELTMVTVCCAVAIILGIILHKTVEYPVNRYLAGRSKPVQTEASAGV